MKTKITKLDAVIFYKNALPVYMMKNGKLELTKMLLDFIQNDDFFVDDEILNLFYSERRLF